MTYEEVIDSFVENVQRDVEKWKRANEEYFEDRLTVSIRIKIQAEDSYEVRTYEI